MHRCAICQNPIDEAGLNDLAGEHDIHPACLANRVPQDALVALLAAVALTLAPPIVVWAG